jgi:hypothetical protein
VLGHERSHLANRSALVGMFDSVFVKTIEEFREPHHQTVVSVKFLLEMFWKKQA